MIAISNLVTEQDTVNEYVSDVVLLISFILENIKSRSWGESVGEATNPDSSFHCIRFT